MNSNTEIGSRVWECKLQSEYSNNRCFLHFRTCCLLLLKFPLQEEVPRHIENKILHDFVQIKDKYGPNSKRNHNDK